MSILIGDSAYNANIVNLKKNLTIITVQHQLQMDYLNLLNGIKIISEYD